MNGLKRLRRRDDVTNVETNDLRARVPAVIGCCDILRNKTELLINDYTALFNDVCIKPRFMQRRVQTDKTELN